MGHFAPFLVGQFPPFCDGQFHPFSTGLFYPSLLGQVYRVFQYTTRTLRKGVPLDRRAGRGGGFGADAVAVERRGVVARRDGLVGIGRSVVPVIDVEFSGGGHGRQRAQLGTADAAEGAVRESGEKVVRNS